MTKHVDRLIDDLEARVRLLVCPITYSVVVSETEDGDTKKVTLTESGLDGILRRARMLLDVERRAGRAVVDGFPSTTPGNGSPGGGKGGGRLMAIPPDDQHRFTDLVPTTSTEAAALAEGVKSDPVSELAVRVTAHLRRLAHEIECVDATLGEWERMRMVSKVPDPQQCYIVGKLLGLPFDDYWDPTRTTTFPKLDDPQFDDPRRVCDWAYWFVMRNNRLPTKDEALRRLREVTASRLAGRAG
jgi:hypothetical protein